MFMFMVCVTGTVSAQQLNCSIYERTTGYVYWNAADSSLAAVGLQACFTDYRYDNCLEFGDRIHLVNSASFPIQVRAENGFTVTINPRSEFHGTLNNNNPLRLELTYCPIGTGSGSSINTERGNLGSSFRDANYNYSGSLSYGGIRSYRQTVSRTVRAIINLESNDFDAFLTLYRDGERIQTNDDGGEGLNSRIERILNPGTYTIEVSSFNNDGSGSYSLQMDFIVY